MKRILTLMLALGVLAGCSQPQEPTAAAAQSAATPAAAPAATQTQAPAAATTAAAQTTSADVERIQLAQVDLSAVTAAGFVEGVNYRRLSPTQPTGATAGQVEVDEFFMYSCPHCYNLEPYVQAWLPDKPDFINFVRVPTTWDEWRKLHAQAFYAAEALGKGEEMHMPFYQEIHNNGNYLDNVEKVRDFFGRFGVSRADFNSVFDSFSVHTKLNRADELGRRYRVDSTPTFIINGKYRTDVGMADPTSGNPEKLFELVGLLAAAEAGR